MSTFPLAEMHKHPEDFRLLTRVPYTKDKPFPLKLAETVGDEIHFVILDTETTGLDSKTDEMIELGVIGISYSPSAQRITQINGCADFFEQPSVPIPEIITQITGLTDADVAGFRIDDSHVEQIFSGVSLVIAHNAQFDRGFFDRRFPQLSNLPWACSIKDVNWQDYGLEGNKLLFLLYQLGFFYEAHRADIDCIATLRLFQEKPEALNALIASASKSRVTIRCHTAPFNVKDQLKERGYKWSDVDPNAKHWHGTVDSDKLDEELEWLKNLCPTKYKNFVKEPITAHNRYK